MKKTAVAKLRSRRELVAFLPILFVSSALLAGMLAPSASAITVNLINGGGTPPNNAVGGGNLTANIAAARALWENAIHDAHVVTLTYSWGPQPGTTLAAHNLVTQAGVPNRETVGTIVFDNDGSSNYFIDPTPTLNEEWDAYTESFQNNVGGAGGNMNTARFFSGPLGNAVGKWDLFTVALHEMGHALGMSSLNTAYQGESWPDNDIDIALAGLPHIGAQIPTNNGANPELGGSSNAHINNTGVTPAKPFTINSPFVIMNPGHGGEVGIREYCSCADILANAQISQWNDVNCTAVIPEPASICLIGLGMLGLPYAWRRRHT